MMILEDKFELQLLTVRKDEAAVLQNRKHNFLAKDAIDHVLPNSIDS